VVVVLNKPQSDSYLLRHLYNAQRLLVREEVGTVSSGPDHVMCFERKERGGGRGVLISYVGGWLHGL